MFLILLSSALTLTGCKNNNRKAAVNPNAAQENGTVQKLSLIEIVGQPGTAVNEDILLQIGEENGIIEPAVYKWNNHLVLLGIMKEPENVRKQILARLPDANVNIYTKPFYEFNRKQCSDATVAKEWDHVLLTANLVKDAALRSAPLIRL